MVEGEERGNSGEEKLTGQMKKGYAHISRKEARQRGSLAETLPWVPE